jgi:hypothetical protein
VGDWLLTTLSTRVVGMKIEVNAMIDPIIMRGMPIIPPISVIVRKIPRPSMIAPPNSSPSLITIIFQYSFKFISLSRLDGKRYNYYLNILFHVRAVGRGYPTCRDGYRPN